MPLLCSTLDLASLFLSRLSSTTSFSSRRFSSSPRPISVLPPRIPRRRRRRYSPRRRLGARLFRARLTARASRRRARRRPPSSAPARCAAGETTSIFAPPLPIAMGGPHRCSASSLSPLLNTKEGPSKVLVVKKPPKRRRDDGFLVAQNSTKAFQTVVVVVYVVEKSDVISKKQSKKTTYCTLLRTNERKRSKKEYYYGLLVLFLRLKWQQLSIIRHQNSCMAITARRLICYQ